MKFSSPSIAALAAALSNIDLALAQGAAWSQCGGVGWTGATTCVSGYTCQFSNEWYSQCVPGAAATTTARTTLTTATTSAPTGTVAPFTSYATTAGNVFSINGKKEYFSGTNTYWIGFLTNNADVDLVMSHIAATQLKVLRVWGFNIVSSTPSAGTVWYQSLIPGQSPAINTGANGLQRLDYVVQSAEAHGVSLIINFVNNWADFGGQPAYQAYYGLSDVGFYTSTAAQATYQAYIAAVVSRYKTSKNIFAWELCNEPRCTGCDTSVITNWVKTTSAYIKSLDPNHMVCIGDEGFGLAGGTPNDFQYSDGSGTDFSTNLAISTIDFGTFHLYPESWGETEAWGTGWIDSHNAAGLALGKPVILEEYGPTNHTEDLVYQAQVMQDNVAGDMYWQFGDTISTGQTAQDGNTIYFGTAEFNQLVAPHAAAMAAKAV